MTTPAPPLSPRYSSLSTVSNVAPLSSLSPSPVSTGTMSQLPTLPSLSRLTPTSDNFPILPTNTSVPSQIYNTTASNIPIAATTSSISPQIYNTSPTSIPVFTPTINPTPMEDHYTEQQDLDRLYIYNGLAQVVRRLNLDNGAKTIHLPKSVKVNSIAVKDEADNSVSFAFIPELNTNKSIIGKFVEINKDGDVTNGKLLSLHKNCATLIADDRVVIINKFDKLEVLDVEEQFHPQLILSANSSDLTLSYLLGGVTWKCIGNAIISDDNSMDLDLNGSVTNDTGENITADLSLVSGKIYYKDSDVNYKPMAMARSVEPSEPDEPLMEDYTKYRIGERIIHSKDLINMNKSYNFPVIKLYIHQISENNVVKFGYRFLPNEHIPDCIVNIYNSEMEYLGSSSIASTQGNRDDVDLIIGESTKVQCKSEIIRSEGVLQDGVISQQQQQQQVKGKGQGSWHYISENIKVTIINNNDEQSSLLLRHFVGDKPIISYQGLEYKNRKDGFLEWYFHLSPNMEDVIEIQIVTGSYF